MNEDNAMNGESEDLIKDKFIHETDKEGVESSVEDEVELPPREDSESGQEKKNTSHSLSDFIHQLEQEATAEGKIRLSLEFMRVSLSSNGTPRFKDFWEGRRLCLPLFKENIPQKMRSQLWGSYVELSDEAKRLKEILDEQSAFAVEQIELAIQALERDLENYDLILSQTQNLDLSFQSVSLKEREEMYLSIQKELMLLNTLASRVNAMRKEVVKTEMRIRIKNKLLDRLSLCGDKIFPKRKDLIKEISQIFMSDVDQFISSYFNDQEFERMPLYVLREEIKQLQSIAKVLTLNTHAFTETRLKLSGCWDKLKSLEKERKKEAVQKRQVYQQNYDLVLEKVRSFAALCMEGISLDECNKLSNEILDFMRTVELGRDEVKALKEEIYRAKRGPADKAKEEEAERQRKEKEIETLRRERINSLKEELHALLADASNMEIETLSVRRDTLMGQFLETALVKAEKQIVDRLFKQLKDAIDEKQEKALLMLSEDDLKALDQLKAVLEERKTRRAEIKNLLEQYRKQLGGSGFDFEKAMLLREMIEAEKLTLEKMNASIHEIEEKIDEIEG